MKGKWLVLGGALAAAGGTIAYVLLRKPPVPPSEPVFADSYEEEPKIYVMTSAEWAAMTLDALKGIYFRDVIHWLEMGTTDLSGRYKFDTTPSVAHVTTEVRHAGSRSAYLNVPPVPNGYLNISRVLARYFRDPEVVKPGAYLTEAWYYVPSETTPIAYLWFEDYLLWDKGQHLNVALDSKNGLLVYADEEFAKGYKVLGETNFQHDTWFKLSILFDTMSPEGYTVGYESRGVKKTFEIDHVWTSANIFYKGYVALNIYAGIVNHTALEQELYVDDFSCKRLI